MLMAQIVTFTRFPFSAMRIWVIEAPPIAGRADGASNRSAGQGLAAAAGDRDGQTR
jgi:hypothetical protein